MKIILISLLMTAASAQALPVVSPVTSPVMVVPAPITAAQSAAVAPAPAVKLPDTPELRKPVQLVVPVRGLSLDSALTVIAKTVGLTVMTQGLPDVTLRAGLSSMSAKQAITTLINLYAPQSSAALVGKLLVVGDESAVRRVTGQLQGLIQPQVINVAASLTDAQVTRLSSLYPSVTMIMFDAHTLILSGPEEALGSVRTLLRALPAPAPTAPTASAQATQATVTRVYTVGSTAQATDGAIKDLVPDIKTAVVADQLVIKGSAEAQQAVNEILKQLPAPTAPVPPSATEPTRRQSFNTPLPAADSAYLSAMIAGIKVTSLDDQHLLIAEGTGAQLAQAAELITAAKVRREQLITAYYPVTGNPTALIPTLKRAAPDAEINAVEGRNMLAIQALPSAQVQLADLIRTLQSGTPVETAAKDDLITRTITLGYTEALVLANNLANLKLPSTMQLQNPALMQVPIAVGVTSPVPTAAALTATTSAANNLNIVPDERTNSLLITGPRSQVMEMISAIASLDVPMKNLRIRLRVEQLNDTDLQNLGINWNLGIAGMKFGQTDGSLSIGYAPSLAPASIGLTLNTAKQLGNARTIIDSNFAALSGQDTTFQNGGELLFPATTSIQNGSSIVTPGQTYAYGLDIKVKPRVAPDGTVVMSMDTTIGSSPSAGPQNSVQTTKQHLQSVVQVRPGETLVLGGVVLDNYSAQKKGVPILSDLPLIGPLFGSKTNTVSKQTLLFVVSAEEIQAPPPTGTQSVALPAVATPATVTPPTPTAQPPKNDTGTQTVELPAQP